MNLQIDYYKSTNIVVINNPKIPSHAPDTQPTAAAVVKLEPLKVPDLSPTDVSVPSGDQPKKSSKEGTQSTPSKKKVKRHALHTEESEYEQLVKDGWHTFNTIISKHCKKVVIE